MTRIYSFMVVCDVYEGRGCHNAFVVARAGMLSDVLEAPEAQAEAAGWRVGYSPDEGPIDLCPACAARWRGRTLEERRGLEAAPGRE